MTLNSPILSLVSDSDNSELVGLFSKSVKKREPVYDYSTVPAWPGNEVNEEAEENKEDLPIKPSGTETQEKINEVKEIQKHDRMAQVKHEDSKPRQINPETEAKTVFVGNLSSGTKKKTLKKMFSKYGVVETVRFRCAARPDLKTTKKVAVIKHKFHEERNNICAYVRMSTIEEAEAACALNGSVIDGFTVRVDMALKNKTHDNKKSVFLGNLDFKTEEEDIHVLIATPGEF